MDDREKLQFSVEIKDEGETYRLIIDGDPAKYVIIGHAPELSGQEFYAAIGVMAQAIRELIGAENPVAARVGTA